MADPQTPPDLVEALCADQRERWARGERVLVEAYVAEHPALASEAGWVTELVYNEILLREEQGETPELAEFLRRFPHLGPDLDRVFDVHHALESGFSLRPSGPAPTGHGTAAETWKEQPGGGPAIPGYELQEELGRGGMGVVYRARDGRLDRIVAVKMILVGGQAGPEELARFRAEAQSQARLQHPHIVQIFEVGEADGRPFFALEYVDGGSLAQRLGGKPQPAVQAAALAETLARAVEHAHERGLVHRDLKPANVLLTREGQPKVTDFGLVKRLEGEGGETRTGAIMGTPSYMAPEQAAGQVRKICPATDVWALGAILYEMLTGRPPFLGESPLDTLMQVRSQELVPLRRLQPKVPRDLETVCLKCLEKDIGRRYASAAELADDLARFLDGRPTRARPVRALGRLGRWCRRKPAVATLTAALVLVVAGSLPTLIGLGVGAAASAREAEERSRVAEQRLRERSEAVRQHFIVLSEIELSKEPGTQELQQRLLEEALRYFRRFLQDRPDDPALLADVAEAHFRVGSITRKIGSREEALIAFEQARELFDRLVQDHPGDTLLLRKQASNYQHLGHVQLEMGRHPDCLRSFRKAQALWEQLGPAAQDTQLQKEQAGVYLSIGNLRTEQGEWAKALDSYQKAQGLFERLARGHPAATEFQSGLALCYNNQAVLKRQNSQPDEALRLHRQAQAIQDKLVAANPTLSEFRRELAGTRHNIGLAQRDLGRLPEALRSHEQARALREKLVQANPQVALYQGELARSHNRIGLLQHEQGQRDEALGSFEQARAIQQKLVEADPGAAEYRSDLSHSLSNIGRIHREAGKPAEALALYEQARAVLEKLLKATPTSTQHRGDLALCHYHIALVHQTAGRWAEAVTSYGQAQTLGEESVRDAPKVVRFQSDLAASYNDRGTLHHTQDQPDEALRCYTRAHTLYRNLVEGQPKVPQFQVHLSLNRYNTGNLHRERGRLGEAQQAYEEACTHFEKLVGRNPNHLGLLSNLCFARHAQGETLQQLKRPEEARTAFREAIRHQRVLLEKGPQKELSRAYLGKHSLHLARTCQEMGRHAEVAEAAAELAAAAGDSGDTRYHAACIYALASATADHAGASSQADHYADQAVRQLSRARTAGLTRVKVEHLKHNPDLAPLRSRPDFQKLLAEWERPDEATAAGKRPADR